MARSKLAALFSRNLRKVRERQELTRAQLAARAGVSESYVYMLENGTREAPLAMIERLAGAMGVKDPRSMLKGKLS